MYTPASVTIWLLRIVRSRAGMKTVDGSTFTTQEKLVQIVSFLMYLHTFANSNVLT